MTAPVRDDAQRSSAVGSSWPRLDSREKVVGATRYAADIPVPLPGLLHGRLVLSPYAHARIDRNRRPPRGLAEHPFSTKRGNTKSKSGTDKQAGGRKGHQ